MHRKIAMTILALSLGGCFILMSPPTAKAQAIGQSTTAPKTGSGTAVAPRRGGATRAVTPHAARTVTPHATRTITPRTTRKVTQPRTTTRTLGQPKATTRIVTQPKGTSRVVGQPKGGHGRPDRLRQQDSARCHAARYENHHRIALARRADPRPRPHRHWRP